MKPHVTAGETRLKRCIWLSWNLDLETHRCKQIVTPIMRPSNDNQYIKRTRVAANQCFLARCFRHTVQATATAIPSRSTLRMWSHFGQGNFFANRRPREGILILQSRVVLPALLLVAQRFPGRVQPHKIFRGPAISFVGVKLYHFFPVAFLDFCQRGVLRHI